MTLKNLSILFVEDDPVFRHLVTSFLEARGAQVFEAKDGEAGLSYLEQYRFDMIIADLSMPNLGGLEMLKRISKGYPKVPSIVMSGSPVMSDVLDALRHGASDYLVKPISDLYLIENAIHECLNTDVEVSFQLDNAEDLSYLELQQHLHLLEQDKQAAKSVQQQLLPPSPVRYQHGLIEYSLFNNSPLSAHFIDTAMVDDKHIMIYMAQFHPQDNRVAFASVLLKSFVNFKLKRFRNQLSDTLIKPQDMLVYLNERMSQSGLDIYVDMAYIIVTLADRRASIAQAGSALRCYLRNDEGLTPIALPETLQLGVLNWGQPSVHERFLQGNERLCIATHAPEHRERLLNDEFHGLMFDDTILQGGYIQLGLK
ncbi:response regulator [Shewanella surugensis]|uniref:Response regulator n=1 Tax=Shewanella surugensis TaxID=212020 RepID=A0ABT0L843_9GAMM|nr:response regulator [Shewanella surugensis]MCL1123869.1 response regulator [Shewanella surugensis]